jgi:hypothetical protein
MSAPIREVGITVLPEFFQNEGVEAVLDNIQRRSGATAIATSPYVMRPVPDGEGSREPPIDAGAGSVRILDRTLWGRRDLWVRTSPSYEPDRKLYAGLRYQPAEPDEHSAREGRIVAAALAQAKARGIRTHLQVQAAIPPGYRVQFGGPVEEDRPRLPDGSSPVQRVDNNGSLASPHILAYTQALIRDLVAAYPGVDVLRIDWPEYPPYSLDALFFDFSAHARAAMAADGFDPDRLAAAARRLHHRMTTGLTPADLAAAAAGGGWFLLARGIVAERDIADWLAAKAAIVTRFIAACVATLRDVSGGSIALMPQAFPAPWNICSGFDMRAVARTGVAGIGVKLYTMHWPMMLRSYANSMAVANRLLADSSHLGPALMRVFDVDDRPELYAVREAIRYPEPEEPHPVGAAQQRAKMAAAVAEASSVPVTAFAHGYGPVADVEARARIAFEAAGGRLFVNRYGYLSDAKLDAIGRATGMQPN